MSIDMSTKLFTCGRMHKQSLKHKLHQDRAAAIVAAVCKVMQAELSKGACERWISRLNMELGDRTFSSSESAEVARAAEPPPVPRVWVPAKPKLTAALLDGLEAGLQNVPSQTSVGSKGEISKVLARRVVESTCRDKGRGWLETCGELSLDTIDNSVKLGQTLSRVAFELFVYVHARAVELQGEEESPGVLELHSSDQTLVGRGQRGCGLVYCGRGREALVRSIELARNTISSNVAA